VIVRHGGRKRWTTVDRDVVNDKRLSFRARGVLVWLLDKPDTWEVRSNAIAGAGPEGRDAIRAAFQELEQFGYMKHRKVQHDDGRWVTETWVYERPGTDSQASVVGNQASENRASVSQALYQQLTSIPDRVGETLTQEIEDDEVSEQELLNKLKVLCPKAPREEWDAVIAHARDADVDVVEFLQGQLARGRVWPSEHHADLKAIGLTRPHGELRPIDDERAESARSLHEPKLVLPPSRVAECGECHAGFRSRHYPECSKAIA
jgi:hypothetical protein